MGFRVRAKRTVSRFSLDGQMPGMFSKKNIAHPADLKSATH